MKKFLYEIWERSNMHVRGRDGDRGSNGISINQGTANTPKSQQMLGDLKSMLPPIAQGKPVLTTICFCIYELQHCGRTPDALNYRNCNYFWWLPMETSQKTMRRWEYSLSMKTKWYGVWGGAVITYLFSVKKEKSGRSYHTSEKSWGYREGPPARSCGLTHSMSNSQPITQQIVSRKNSPGLSCQHIPLMNDEKWECLGKPVQRTQSRVSREKKYVWESNEECLVLHDINNAWQVSFQQILYSTCISKHEQEKQ